MIHAIPRCKETLLVTSSGHNNSHIVPRSIALSCLESMYSWLEILANSIDSSSAARKLGRYFLHGLILGAVVLVASIGMTLIGIASSYLTYMLLGSSLIGAAFYAMIFALTGGMNQALAERYWGISCEKSIGTGMRDGFLIFMVFNIAFLPVALVFSIPPWYGPPSALEIAIIFLVGIPIYILLLGIIGAKTAVFLHEDKEPVMPSDFVERSHQCPHCMARYYYGPGTEREGVVTCQNCGKQFSINR